jgi:hypothetical protein
MATLTYDLGVAAGTVKTAAPAAPQKGFWKRLLDALIEARMREAERQIRMHLHLIPESVLAENGFKATYKDADKLPFVK